MMARKWLHFSGAPQPVGHGTGARRNRDQSYVAMNDLRARRNGANIQKDNQFSLVWSYDLKLIASRLLKWAKLNFWFCQVAKRFEHCTAFPLLPMFLNCFPSHSKLRLPHSRLDLLLIAWLTHGTCPYHVIGCSRDDSEMLQKTKPGRQRVPRQPCDLRQWEWFAQGPSPSGSWRGQLLDQANVCSSVALAGPRHGASGTGWVWKSWFTDSLIAESLKHLDSESDLKLQHQWLKLIEKMKGCILFLWNRKLPCWKM